MCEMILVALYCTRMKLSQMSPKNIPHNYTRTCSQVLMCEVFLVTLHCITMKLLNISNNKMPKFSPNKCCSITRRRPLMCVVILVTLHCFSVLHFVDSPSVLSHSHLHVETNVICPAHRKASFDENEVVAHCSCCLPYYGCKEHRLGFYVSLMSYKSRNFESVNILPTLTN